VPGNLGRDGAVVRMSEALSLHCFAQRDGVLAFQGDTAHPSLHEIPSCRVASLASMLSTCIGIDQVFCIDI
jgi:hypothetical protein